MASIGLLHFLCCDVAEQLRHQSGRVAGCDAGFVSRPGGFAHQGGVDGRLVEDQVQVLVQQVRLPGEVCRPAPLHSAKRECRISIALNYLQCLLFSLLKQLLELIHSLP